MHNEDIERPTDHGDDLREAVIAADDTGLVSQQEILTVAELGDAPTAEESSRE
jgi:hypothetical protein